MAIPLNGPVARTLGRFLRRFGQTLDGVGAALQEKEGYVEKLVPSTRVVPFKGKDFQHGLQNFLASTGSTIGDVKVGEMTSIWYGATARGDKGSVQIGKRTAVLDNANVSAPRGATKIGDEVVISTGAIVQSAEIGDGTMIGMGAVVLPGARIGSDCFIDGGAVVASNTVIPPGQLWTGSPAKFLRNLTPDEMSYIRSTAADYVALWQVYAEQEAKTPDDVEADEEKRIYKIEIGVKEADPIPEMAADVIEYYKLTAPRENDGLLRDFEYDRSAELKLSEAEEVAADKAEEQYYSNLARVKRMGRALAQIAAVRADKINAADVRAKIIADLKTLDPLAAQELQELLVAISDAAARNDSSAKAGLLDTLIALDPDAGARADEAEATAEATKAFNTLAQHGQALSGRSAQQLQ